MYMDKDTPFGASQVGDDSTQGVARFRIFFPDRAKDPSQYYQTRQIVDQYGKVTPDTTLQDYGDPKIISIQVAGDFQQHLSQQNWDFEAAPMLLKQPHPKGWVWACDTQVALPAGFYQYKYYVTFQDGTKRKVGDPCARYGGNDGKTQNSGFVIGGSSPAQNTVMPLAQRKHLRDLVVYELMIADFTAEYREERAPLDAVTSKLDYLQGLGINAILFMPWTAWPGNGFNWGYTPYQYFSVEYRYANAMLQPSEKISWLKRLINECHTRGIHVIMDGVFNHVGDAALNSGVADGFPYRWLYQDPALCPYVGTFGGVFPGLTDLDYSSGCTREFIRDVCFYWIDQFQIDGIRFDNATNFYVPNTLDGLPTLLDDIYQHLSLADRDSFSLTLEYLDLTAANVTNTTRATSYWNNGLYERSFDYLWNWDLDSRIMDALNMSVGLNADKVPTSYIGNHDHSHVAWQAGARNNDGSLEWYRLQPYMIALFTCPGTPMIQNGQEFGEDYWLMEDDQGTGRRVKSRPLRWDLVNDSIGSTLNNLYKRLIAIRLAHPGLRTPNFYPNTWEGWQTEFTPEGYGVDVQKQVVIYHRWGAASDGSTERLIVVINFSKDAQYVDIPFPTNGTWNDLLNNQNDQVDNFILPNQQIPSNWGRIYQQND